jgi:RNA polymerase sigma-70 factor (ECF subfamily)
MVPPHEVEDIVQESYVRLCEVKSEEDIRSPHSYLVRTIRNLALDYAKRAATRLNVSVDSDEQLTQMSGRVTGDETYAKVASAEEFGHFCEAVRHLPVQCRRVFVLKRVYGYSQQEVAQELGVSVSAVEKQLAIAVQRCTAFMLQHDSNGEGLVAAGPVRARAGRSTDE